MVAEEFRNFMLYGVMTSISAPAGDQAKGGGAFAPEAKSGGDRAAKSDAGEDIRWITPSASRRTLSSDQIELLKYRFVDCATRDTVIVLYPGETIVFEIVFRMVRPTHLHSFGFTLHDRHGMIAVHLNSEFFGIRQVEATCGRNCSARFRFDVPMLTSGEYSLSFGCSENEDGVLIEKYDYDSTITIDHPRSPVTDRQGGYVIIPSGGFECVQYD